MQNDIDILEVCRHFAGDHFLRMQESRTATRELLQHHEPQIRLAALLMLAFHWDTSVQTQNDLLDRVKNDVDPTVRGLAAFVAAAVTDNVGGGEVLARIVQNEEYPDALRWNAYLGLVVASDVEISRLLALHAEGLPAVVADSVDWEFIDQILGQ
jgi:hypothetical protein